MDNPYWTTEGQTHHIDLTTVQRLCFELFNIVEASRAVADQFVSAEEEEGRPLDAAENKLFTLHRSMAEKQISQLLLQLALLVRTYDDIMAESEHADAYRTHAGETSGENYIGDLSGGQKFDLREACNKVIHAREIRCLYENIERSADAEEEEHSGAVQYLTGEIELSGRYRGNEWDATLYLSPFLEIVLDRIAFTSGDNAKQQQPASL